MVYIILQSPNFSDWFAALRDQEAKQRIARRLDRFRFGNPGDVRPVGAGVSELRIDYGPGYRLYYKQVGDVVFLMLCGGDKATQKNDIALALKMARDL